MASNQCSASLLASKPSLIDRPREVRVPSFGHDFLSENCYSGSITRKWQISMHLQFAVHVAARERYRVNSMSKVRHTPKIFFYEFVCFLFNDNFNFILFRFLSSISLLCFVINQSNLLKVPCCIGNSNICLRAKHLKISCVERKGLKFGWAKLHRKIKLFAAMCTLKWSGSRINPCHISRFENFIIFRLQNNFFS